MRVSARPAGSARRTLCEHARAGTERWLVVKATPEQAFAQARQFWTELGFVVAVEQPTIGVMETDWAENRAQIPQDGLRRLFGKILDSVYSTAERDKYRTRLEKTSDGSTEIYISHRGMSELYISEEKADTRWQPRPPDPELEAEMLRRLMARLGNDETKTKTMPAEVVKQDRAKLNRLDRIIDGGVSGSHEHRNMLCVGIALDLPKSVNAVHARQAHIKNY